MEHVKWLLVPVLLCVSFGNVANAQPLGRSVLLDTTTWVDSTRGRTIPLATYSSTRAGEQQPLVLLSHGYNENLRGTYLSYGYLAEFLAERGYCVVSIQHELPSDAPLAMKGDLHALRAPVWERGAQTIGYVLNGLKKTRRDLDFTHVTLIGHSNGGDMSVLFAQQHPEKVACLITLDNRRMPLPRTAGPRVMSLRSSDAPADAGVLPSAEERSAFGIRIIDLPDVKHNEMSDRANAAQRAKITGDVIEFLNGE